MPQLQPQARLSVMSVLRLCVDILLLGTLVCCAQALELERDRGYDELDSVLFSYETLHTHHLKHSLISHPNSRRIQFSSLGRNFELRLKPTQRFATNFAAYSHDANGNAHRFHINIEEFYEGHVHGEEGSRVTAHLSPSGILSAYISTHNETYHVEPSAHYLTRPHTLHMIAYRSSQVKDRLKTARVDYTVAPSIPEPELHLEKSETRSSLKFDTHRLKRQLSPDELKGRSCGIILVADHTMISLLSNKESIASRIIQLVLALDTEIYRTTQWIVRGSSVTNLGMFIERVLVHETPDDSVYRYNTAQQLDAGELLGLMRFSDWSEYCLAHLFVNRDFPSGLLGLANIASPSSRQTGGICSTRFRDSALPGAPSVIYNTGLTTLRNHGQVMIMSELVRVTGHEIGHNWGAHHDAGSCGSGWLMNEFAQDGSEPTHSEFSECSRTGIGGVLRNKAGCFREVLEEACGNYRVEVENGEACDVGGDDDDPCCDAMCQLRDLAKCSDRNSECCVNCQIAPNDTVCRQQRSITPDCKLPTFCNGVNETCPESPSAPAGSLCVNGTCVDGGDGVTLCEPLCNMNDSCVCSNEEECLFCCMSNGECVPYLLENMTLLLSNGAPCSRGACFEGNCSRGIQDEISRIWQIIVTFDVDALRVLASENIVGFVLIFSVLCWCPFSCMIHWLYDQLLWERFLKKGSEETDHSSWFSERIAAYRALASSPKASGDEQKQPLLETVEEERPRSVSPVDSLPPPY